ncbi:MAG: M23 family metallopeptidase, partial [Oscillospiraceae bacterium]|nr:M23 family metallopeptidase [Oscillospiraceae bacterium]
PTIPTTRPTTAPTETTNQAGAGNVVDGIVWYTPTKNFRVSSKFGYRYHPISGKYSMHQGIDMAAPKNTPIFATRAGYVNTASYQEGGAGYYVSLNHGDGYRSIYMHMTRYVVKKGDYVEAGQIIGYVGSTGDSTGNHLHFGISYNGTYVDPELYIDT